MINLEMDSNVFILLEIRLENSGASTSGASIPDCFSKLKEFGIKERCDIYIVSCFSHIITLYNSHL